MEQDFYIGRLRDEHGLQVLTPAPNDRSLVNQVIYGELCQGIINPESRVIYQRVMQELVDRGAQAILLGCTEIGLLVSDEDAPVPVFDTTRLHVEQALSVALTDEPG